MAVHQTDPQHPMIQNMQKYATWRSWSWHVWAFELRLLCSNLHVSYYMCLEAFPPKATALACNPQAAYGSLLEIPNSNESVVKHGEIHFYQQSKANSYKHLYASISIISTIVCLLGKAMGSKPLLKTRALHPLLFSSTSCDLETNWRCLGIGWSGAELPADAL